MTQPAAGQAGAGADRDRDRDTADRDTADRDTADRDTADRDTADRDTADRDRDTAGRPRNARPRDGLGRPLERDATGEPAMPDDLRLTPGEAVGLAQRLIDDGRPFHAHEVLEAAWKSGPDDERELWQGLAQVAVGLTHARRGNDRGAVTLLRRGAASVDGYLRAASGASGAGGLDPAGSRDAATDLADRIAANGLTALTADDLRLQLIRPSPPAPVA